MNTSVRTFCLFTFAGLLLAANAVWGQTNRSSALFPFPQADYNYPTASHSVVDPAVDDSNAGTWRYPGTSQPPVAGPSFEAASFDMSDSPDKRSFDEPIMENIDDDFVEVGNSSCADERCADSACQEEPDSGWFGSASALFMTLNEGGHYHFSFDSQPCNNTDHIQLLDIREAEMGVSGGFDVRLGRYFNGGRHAVELVYWGLYPGVQQAVLTPDNFAGSLNAILNFGDVSIDGSSVDSWTDNADAHSVKREFSIHNAEINFLNFRGCTIYDGFACPKFGFSWNAGFRFFHFSEGLMFSARENGGGANFDDGQNQVDYSIDVDNNLFGGQIGGESRWFATERLSIVLNGKLGVFGNSIQHHSRIQDERGRIAIVDSAGVPSDPWDVSARKTDVAFLAELNLGASYCLTQQLSLIAGYRVLGVSGVALSAEQIPNDLRRVNDAYIIDSDNSLLLHGGYAGIEFLY